MASCLTLPFRNIHAMTNDKTFQTKLFSKGTLKPFDYFLILGIISLNIIYSILTKEIDIIGSLAAITGVICVVLVAKRSMLNYIFGIINVSLYAYISYKALLYGDAALNALYYLPMQFIGWISWSKKTQEEDKSRVKSKRMSNKERLLWALGSTTAVIIVGFILKYFNDPQPFKDSATTILSIIAMFLMVRTYMEQWFIWVVVNVISVVMWVIATLRGDAHAMLMIFMWIFYLANSINGLITWGKITSSTDYNLK